MDTKTQPSVLRLIKQLLLRDVLQTEIVDVEIIEKYREMFHLADSINSQHWDGE